MLLLNRHPGLGKFLVASALTLLYLLSTPFVAGTMLQKLEIPFAPTISQSEAQVIVLLGSGTYFNAAEYGGDTVSRYGPGAHSLCRAPASAHRQADTGDRWRPARQQFFRSSTDESGAGKRFSGSG